MGNLQAANRAALYQVPNNAAGFGYFAVVTVFVKYMQLNAVGLNVQSIYSDDSFLKYNESTTSTIWSTDFSFNNALS